MRCVCIDFKGNLIQVRGRYNCLPGDPEASAFKTTAFNFIGNSVFMGFCFSSFKTKGFNTMDSELAEQPALPLEQSLVRCNVVCF